MKFKPVTEKYKYSDETLLENIPNYMITPIAEWIRDILEEASLYQPSDGFSSPSINTSLINRLNILFRETFPNNWEQFLLFLFKDKDRIINFLAICIQNFAHQNNAANLEQILADGGSAWSVISTHPNSYQMGTFELVRRVPNIVQEVSESAIQNEELLREAWIACYSKNPDYEKTVSKCVDVLEGLFRNKYFPNDTKPVLTKFINDFKANPTILSYKGSNLLTPKNALTDIASNFISIRGQHTKGTGRKPSKDEAEFVVHYTIFVWNLFQ